MEPGQAAGERRTFAQAAASIAPTRASTLVEEIRLMVSCGSYQDDLRDVAERALLHVAHAVRYDLRAPFNVIYWDYRLDESRDEIAGEMPQRSLEAVKDSDGVIAILGHLVPPITQLEVRQHYELANTGLERQLWVFADNRQARVAQNPAALPTRQAFLEEIKRDFGKERWCTPVATEMEFQASMLTKVMPFVLKRIGPAFGPIGPDSQ